MRGIIFIFFGFISIFDGVIGDERALDALKNPQTVTLFTTGDGPSANADPVVAATTFNDDVLTTEMKERHLFRLNDAREHVHPPSSNMQLVLWDDEYEAIAQTWVDTCDPNRFDLLPTGHFSIISTAFSTFALHIETVWNQVIDTFDEYDRETNTCDGTCDYNSLIHYNLGNMGCAARYCDFGALTSFQVCVFRVVLTFNGPGAPVVPYDIGLPCTECESFACDAEHSLCTPLIPNDLQFVDEPLAPFAREEFSVQPKLELYDERGGLFRGTQSPGCPIYVTVELDTRSHPLARLLGETCVPVEDGYATFEDLAIDQPGEYTLTFYISSPDEFKDIEITSGFISVGLPLEHFEACEVMEGEPRFERTYDWGKDCESVTIGDCSGELEYEVTLENCGPHAECIDSECVCDGVRDFEVNIFEAENLEFTLQPEVSCLADSIELRINKCGANALGFKLSDFYVLGFGVKSDVDPHDDLDEQIYPFIESCAYNDCRGHVTADENGLWYTFTIYGNFEDCGGEIEADEGGLTYFHTLRGYGGHQNAIISRARPIEIDYSCNYVTRINTVLSIDNAFVDSVIIEIESDGDFNVEMGFWADPAYTEEYTEPPNIKIPDPIYVAIFVTDIDPDIIKLYADECYVTPSEDPDDKIWEDLIVAGCGVGDVDIFENGDGDEVLFSFFAFAFKGKEESTIFVHCSVHICQEDLTPCTTSCLSKRRRRTASNVVSSKLTLGPINVEETTRRKRSIHHERFSSAFPKGFSTQEVSHPPTHRTAGVGKLSAKFV